jgi:uncharacterized lipoprotein YmbA
MIMALVRAALLGAALLVAACGGSPNFYLLPAPAPQTRAASPVASVSVAEISLPAYADSVEIATLTADGALAASTRELWADTPRRALTRHLVAALEARLGARVAAEPWPEFERPGRRVEVFADQLIGAESPERPLRFSGQYLILAPESGRIVRSGRFDIAVTPTGPGYLALAEAHATAVERLADEIAAAIRGVDPVGV